MRNSTLYTFKEYLHTANAWFLKTPERALDDAYEAALMIKAIEDTHFEGEKISLNSGHHSQSVQAYFQGELTRCLNVLKVRLTEFKASRLLLRLSNQRMTEIQLEDSSSDWYRVNIIDKPALVLKKLKLIDETLARYSVAVAPVAGPLVAVSQSAQAEHNGFAHTNSALERANPQTQAIRIPAASNSLESYDSKVNDKDSMVDNTGVLPRSILNTVDRIRRELDPNSEAEIVQGFRSSKARTIVALRLILLLIIVPLLTQQITKTFVVGPIVDHLRHGEQVDVFLNEEMEEEALEALDRYEERLRFQILTGRVPAEAEAEIEVKLKEKAAELEEEYRQEGNNAVKNIFADIFSLMAFAAVIITNRPGIAALKSFIDEVVYGLSDSAKAFIIILFTDIFVGFHSPHGWEVLLEGVARHLGLPANRDFIFLFIATFPVILDTIFKYWIFRYLNRISPSAVATYRNMNE
jgi:hypothetical protein